jgi:hypothetical protein
MPHKFTTADLDELARRSSLQSPKIASGRWTLADNAYSVVLDVTATNGASKTFKASFDDLDDNLVSAYNRSLSHEAFMDWLSRRFTAQVESWIDSQSASPLRTQVGGSHYKDMAIQPVQFVHANGLDYLTGNVIKYVCRHKTKNGVQDLLKARHYLDLLLELEYGFSASPPDAAEPGSAQEVPGQPPGGSGALDARRP